MEAEILFERFSKNKLNPQKALTQVNDIATAADKRTSAPGVKGKAKDYKSEVPQYDDEDNVIGYYYSFTVFIEKTNYRSETAALKAIDAATKLIKRAAEGRDWKCKGDARDVEEKKALAEARGTFVIPSLTPEVLTKHFSGIYERDAHIRIIHSAIDNYCETDGEERSHILLFGPPAACKTALIQRFKNWVETPENGEGEAEASSPERIAVINTGTLSKAGLENWLLEKAKDGILPNIILFDEVEKFDPNNLLCLLQIMDDQATISKMNARIGRDSAVAKVLCIATCNDVEKLKTFANGAIYSRFSIALPCVRPTRELMVSIMEAKIEERRKRGLSADKRWAKIGVDYCFDVMNTNDPRKIISVVLNGREKLVTGEYQKDLEEVDRAYRLSQ